MKEIDFVKKLEKTYKGEKFYTKREIGVGYGIADLVLFRPHISNCLKRIDFKQFKPLLNEGYFKIFNLLPNLNSKSKPLAFTEIIERTGYSHSFLKYKLLKDLKKAKYIKEINNNYYAKINGWLPIGKELIAIEAKLNDWKRGFYQANRYKAFADKTYLVVPPKISDLIEISLFKKHGVGLIIFDADTGKKQIELQAKSKQTLNVTKRDFASEYFWNLELRKQLATS